MKTVAEIALFTSDVEAATRFYADLLGASPVAEWHGEATFAAGGTKLLVHEHSAATEATLRTRITSRFAVENLDATRDELGRNGVSFLVESACIPMGSLCLPSRPGRAARRTQSDLA